MGPVEIIDDYRIIRKADEDIVLVIDTNIGLDHALGIARSGYNTYFSVVHGQAFPKLESEINGWGFDEIKKVWDFGEGLEYANVVVFADSGFGYLADWLRSKGYAAFGSDDVSERLELDRIYAKKVLEKLGIDVPRYNIAQGIDGVVRAVEEAGGKKVYIKVNRFRGGVETFGTKDPEEARLTLMSGGFAIVGNALKFIVEDSLEGMVEVGVDALFNGKEFISPVFDTIELKYSGNMTKVVDIEDSLWRNVLRKLEPWLAKNGYHGFFCMEGFFDGSKIYVTDITPRYPYVCSYAYPRIIENYGDVIIAVARGEDVEPKVNVKYSAQVSVYTDEMDWKVIDVDDNVKDSVAYRRAVRVRGQVWWVPVEDNVVAVGISKGNVVQDVVRDVQDIVEKIRANASFHRGYEFGVLLGRALEKLSDLGVRW